MFTRARIRLTAWYVAALALFLVALGTAVYQLEEHQLRTNVDHGLRVTADRVREKAHTAGFTVAEASTYGASYTVSWSDGTQALANDEASNRTSVLAAIQHGDDMRTVERHKITTRIYSVRLLGGARPLVVQVARSMEPEEDALHGLLAFMLLGVAGSVAIASIGGWFLAGKSLAPVAAAFHRQQTFVADASHELRTPLAVIRANAEYLQQEQPESEEAAEILAETDRLATLVDALLALARGQAGEAADRPVDLGELVSASAQAMQPLALGRKIALDVATTPGLEVRGNPDQLRQLVLILVDNALRYTPEGGSVHVDARRNDGAAVVAVSDTGIGIDRDALDHVFERFYRADEARTRADAGAGLGLSIAEQLVTGHGGHISAESAPGRGSTFRVSLPLGQNHGG
ncbi:MAG TPA: ATP-binding protein [Gaiellales bacterium]|jgi:signal transduction histidine kinase